VSTNNITRSKQTTRSANMLSVGETFSHCCAVDASLTGAARVYLYQSAPSIFSFVRNLRDQGSPTSIVNRLSEHSARHAFDRQVFDNNPSEMFDQPERKPVLKFIPLISDSSVKTFWSHATALRRRFDPFLRRAILRCDLRRQASARWHHRGFGTAGPSVRAASYSSPRSIPMALSSGGRGLASHSTEKQTYHLPHSRLTVTVLIVPGTGRCSLTSTCPTP
jgi:hypothetical protein